MSDIRFKEIHQGYLNICTEIAYTHASSLNELADLFKNLSEAFMKMRKELQDVPNQKAVKLNNKYVNMVNDITANLITFIVQLEPDEITMLNVCFGKDGILPTFHDSKNT